jgi:ATP-binding protein involved in chromosome partitioning
MRAGELRTFVYAGRMVDRDAVLKALEGVIDPELRRPVTELDMVRDVVCHPDGSVDVTIALTVVGCPLRQSFEDQVQKSVGPLDGVTAVRLHFGVMTPDEKAALVTRLRGGRPEKSIQLDPTTRVIAIASGKGGVGKSTLTANIAYALSERGDRVGVLDADVYGHSIPHMLGIHQRPIAVDEMIVPPVNWDLKLMSIGFFTEDNAPVMWRGPMLHRALEQFLSDVHWGELDTLVVDMPPGTGDVSISLGQLLPRADVVVVTTPQAAAQQVAVRAAAMAEKIGMRITGVIENMSWLVGTGQRIFGEGGGQALADHVGAPLLGTIPLDPALREAADAGTPILVSAPHSEAAVAIGEVADAIRARRPGAIRKALTVL